MFAAPGCLVDSPSHYEPSAQTPPVLLLSQSTPNVLEVQDISPLNDVPPSLAFKVKVRSEDAGDDLVAYLLLDDPKRFALVHTPVKLPASTFDDVTRPDIEFTWTYAHIPALTQGCHYVTLEVTHAKNLLLTESADIAEAVWWLNVSDDGSNLLRDCPKQSESP